MRFFQRRLLIFISTSLWGIGVLANGPVSRSEGGVLTFLGRLHPLVVHFPIGLLIAALLFEGLRKWRPQMELGNAVRLLLAIGFLGAILSAGLGLLLAHQDSYGSSLLDLHQWLGIATMCLSGLTCLVYFREFPKFRVPLLSATVLSVCLAGHYGALLTHGEDYLTSAFSSGSDEVLENGQGDPVPPYINASFKGVLSEDQVQDLNVRVRTIFAHHCYNCHGAVKVKGELRLDSKKFIFKGGKDGPVVMVGDPSHSEIIRRIKLPRSDKKAMPSKGEGLRPGEIAVLEFWITQGAPWPKGPEKSLYHMAALEPRLPALPPAEGVFVNPVDRLVGAYFKQKKGTWKDPVDDRLYIRRVYLDIIGLLPPMDSVVAFQQDPNPDKRAALAKRLLFRSDDYAQHWMSFWNDLLRNDYTGTGYITGGRSDITSWLYEALRFNKPYRDMVRELISPDSPSLGFIRGIQWRGVVNASQRTEMQAAQNVSQVMLGLNLKCASCHDSFISDWKLDEAYGFANLFSDSALEINRCDKPTGKWASRRILFTALGKVDSAAPRKVRLQQLAGALTQPSDGRLYRTFVNRIWAQLMGRGIVEPVDVMDNIPWSQDLLDWLAWDFFEKGTDIRELIFTIVTSRSYQLPSVSFSDPAAVSSVNFVFSGMIRRRLSAEQFADAVTQTIFPIYPDSMVVYSKLPKYLKGALPVVRASLVPNDGFLSALGRPSRETVTTGRTSQANLLQSLTLTNGARYNEVIREGAAQYLQKYPDSKRLVRAVFQNTLNRLPSQREESTLAGLLDRSPDHSAVQDFIWSMTVHPEFQLIY